MQRIVLGLESIIRLHPDQWYMFRPMWPEVSRSHPGLAQQSSAGAGLA
jgi:hypothetical protein